MPKPAHFGCMVAISCQGGAFLPSEAPSGIHQGDILPECDPSSARDALRGCFIQRAPSFVRNESRKRFVSALQGFGVRCRPPPRRSPRCGRWRRRCWSHGSGTVRRKTERDRIMGLSNALYCDKVATMIFSEGHIARSSATELSKANADIAVVLDSCAVMSQHLAQKCMSVCAVMSEHLAQGCFGLAAVASRHWAQGSRCVAVFVPITYRY